VTSADIDPAAPGVIYARLREIPVTTDFMDVTGKPEVRIGLRGHMLETENRHTIIVTELVAILRRWPKGNLQNPSTATTDMLDSVELCMQRKMASGVVARAGAILGVHPVRLWLRRPGHLASCHFSASGSVLGPG